MRKKRFLNFVFLVMLLNNAIHAQTVKTDPRILEDFMSKRFGMFIHWGPVTLRGTEIGWSRGHQVPAEEYDNLYKEFNPVLFDADKWAKAAKDAGMKYLTITAKHHDGFCLWPSAYTDYDIMSSPFKRDIVGELAKACKKYEIAFCIYFTILDWHDKDYPVHNLGDSIPDTKANMPAFVQKIKNQLGELITNYHPYMLWFDGNWEQPWTKEYGQEVYDFIKKTDPRVIVNNRLGKGTHKTMSSETVGDYATPEQEVGSMNMNDPWESCITICHQWAWKPNDKMKSVKESVQTLVSTAGGNGNLLYNVGPMMDGRMEDRQIKLLSAMGQWLSKNGESVYNTKGGPYKPNNVFATTRKDKKIFIQLLKTDSDFLQLLPLNGVKVLKAHFLKGQPVAFVQNEKGIQLNLAGIKTADIIPVIVLELDTEAIKIPVIESM